MDVLDMQQVREQIHPGLRCDRSPEALHRRGPAAVAEQVIGVGVSVTEPGDAEDLASYPRALLPLDTISSDSRSATRREDFAIRHRGRQLAARRDATDDEARAVDGEVRGMCADKVEAVVGVVVGRRVRELGRVSVADVQDCTLEPVTQQTTGVCLYMAFIFSNVLYLSQTLSRSIFQVVEATRLVEKATEDERKKKKHTAV